VRARGHLTISVVRALCAGSNYLEITPENEGALRSGYDARTEQECARSHAIGRPQRAVLVRRAT
jgi:hypothetical protein